MASHQHSESGRAVPGNNISAVEPHPLKPLDGYGIAVTFDGSTLVVTPANKATAVALLGQQHQERVLVLHRTQVVGVQYRAPSALTNGQLTLMTSQGASYQLHFRKKHNVDLWRELAGMLAAP